MAKFLIAAALTTTVAAVPLPRPDGVDHSADEVRMSLTQQIRQHQAYVDHMHDVWRERREAAAAQALREASVSTSSGTSTATPTYSTSGGWADELAAVGFPADAIPTMLYIIDRESGGDPNAVNSSSGACGLTQLWPCYGGSAWLDPMTNLRLAFQKYQASGFSPWSM